MQTKHTPLVTLHCWKPGPDGTTCMLQDNHTEPCVFEHDDEIAVGITVIGCRELEWNPEPCGA